ncbi:hypothetical protein F5B17DRAFT_240112 [Nemania serpens]|nr:hypothetical protein F5B17DRAFT_240112 [Nemania serpens]
MPDCGNNNSSNGYYFLYEWLANIEQEDATNYIELPDLQVDTTSTALISPDSTLYPLTLPEVVITNENGETGR